MGHTIAIVGAAGKVASQMVPDLIKAGHTVHVVGRDRQRLGSLIALGAKPFIGSLTDMGHLESLFSECDAAYLMLPTDYQSNNIQQWQQRISMALAQSLKDSPIRHVVNMSSLGVHVADPKGPLLGLRDQELQLAKIPGINILNLRPGLFFENLFAEASNIMAKNKILGVTAGSQAFPQVSANDIARVATKALGELNFKGVQHIDLVGPTDLSMNQVAEQMSDALDTHLIYQKISYEQLGESLESRGLTAEVSRSMQQLFRAVDANDMVATSNVDRSLTPTTFADFAKIFADRLQKAA